MNAVSSRSHAIFTVTIEQVVEEADVAREECDDGTAEHISASASCSAMSSKFHFVDLAGSERAKRTQVSLHARCLDFVTMLESNSRSLTGRWRPAEGRHKHQLRAAGLGQRDQCPGR